MKRILMTIGLLAVLLAGPGTAFGLEVGIRGYYWFPAIEGEAKVSTGSLEGTQVDLKDDLDVGDEYYPIVEVFAGIGDHHLSASYYQASYEGQKVLTQSINFSGQQFNVNDNVTTELSYSVIDVDYRWDLIDLENFLAGGSLGPVLKCKYVEGTIRMKTAAVNVEESFAAPIPMVGGFLHIGILADLIEFRVQGAGMGYSGANIIEAFADISYTPFPFLDLHVGYRGLWFNADIDDTELQLSTVGPYVALTVSY